MTLATARTAVDIAPDGTPRRAPKVEGRFAFLDPPDRWRARPRCAPFQRFPGANRPNERDATRTRPPRVDTRVAVIRKPAPRSPSMQSLSVAMTPSRGIRLAVALLFALALGAL